MACLRRNHTKVITHVLFCYGKLHVRWHYGYGWARGRGQCSATGRDAVGSRTAIFVFQQGIEGILWLTLPLSPYGLTSSVLTLLFLFFRDGILARVQSTCRPGYRARPGSPAVSVAMPRRRSSSCDVSCLAFDLHPPRRGHPGRPYRLSDRSCCAALHFPDVCFGDGYCASSFFGPNSHNVCRRFAGWLGDLLPVLLAGTYVGMVLFCGCREFRHSRPLSARTTIRTVVVLTYRLRKSDWNRTLLARRSADRTLQWCPALALRR